LGYGLQFTGEKTKEGSEHPYRSEQFEFIYQKTKEFQNNKQISVDTRKKELVGDFQSIGKEWSPKGKPTEVRVHDFEIPALGKVNPYGIYDITQNIGWVNVGTGLSISVCHFPPGISKWNKIEHRLFSFIRQNCRGKPLLSHEVIINLISSTKTRTGLTVNCNLDTKSYEKGRKISDEEVESINIVREQFHGEWNYTIFPPWSPCENDTVIL